MNRSTALRSALDSILPRVQQPSRYLSLERNTVCKDWDSIAIRVALAFPDAYEIGMSHQGSQILYHLINRRPDALAERTYAPMPDMAAALREEGIPLYTLESYRPLGEFDLIGITLQTELNYINVPYMLDLAGIPRLASERTDEHPILLGGGPCTANPEPVADFFDAFLIGDAEAALDTILDTVRDGKGNDRTEVLRSLAQIPGVYVPQFYSFTPATSDEPACWQVLDETVPFPVKRVWVDELDPADQPEAPIVPFASVIQDRLGMEIMRGCTQGCRFCQAGYWYRPVREHDPATVVDRITRQVAETGFEQVGLLSLSTADYSQVLPLVNELADRLAESRTSVSLPSLRADAFSVDLAEAVSKVRKSGFTFAPETGSDRLRRVINKTFTNADMVNAAEAAFSKGWNLLKVYAMIGLPTETDDDLEELARLAEDLVAVGRRLRGRKVNVKVSVGCFVPKPWTPFQWQPFVPADELRRRIYWLKDRFKRIRCAKLSWHDPHEAALEAVLARGDRRLSATISRAHDLGAVLDGWGEHFRLDAWLQALTDTGIDIDHELAERNIKDVLPWDVIDAGIRKNYLKAEWRRAIKESETEDCKWGKCYQCGIPGNGTDIKIAGPQQLPREAAADSPKTTSRPAQLRQPASSRKVRLTFAKTGDSRFLSHRQVMDTLERALRAGNAPVRYTEGFNPHIRLSMGPALSLGHEGQAELFDVDCSAPMRPAHLEATNQRLPDGLSLLDARELMPGAQSLGKMAAAVRYALTAPEQGWPVTLANAVEQVGEGVLEHHQHDNGDITVSLNVRQTDGPMPTIKKFLQALGLDDQQVLTARVTREKVILRPRGRKTASNPPKRGALEKVHP